MDSTSAGTSLRISDSLETAAISPTIEPDPRAATRYCPRASIASDASRSRSTWCIQLNLLRSTGEGAVPWCHGSTNQDHARSGHGGLLAARIKLRMSIRPGTAGTTRLNINQSDRCDLRQLSRTSGTRAD
jgi:hypothetical protein